MPKRLGENAEEEIEKIWQRKERSVMLNQQKSEETAIETSSFGSVWGEELYILGEGPTLKLTNSILM